MMNFYESMESLTSSLHRWVAISWHIKGVRSNDPFKGSIHALEKLVENKKNHSLSCSCLPSASYCRRETLSAGRTPLKSLTAYWLMCSIVNVFVNERGKWKVTYTVPTEFWRAQHFCRLESSWAFRICFIASHIHKRKTCRSHVWDEFHKFTQLWDAEPK